VFTYVAYGLGIHSALELPELVPGPARSDVVVRLGPVPNVSILPPVGGHLLSLADGEARLAWPEVGAILLRRGEEITIDPRPGVAPELLRLYLLGPALGLLLLQRGLVVLHASAATVAGGAVAFLGHSGDGKSTTVAALHARGSAVVADDVLAVDPDAPDGPTAVPGFPQLRLWPDAVSALGESPEALPRLHAGEEKRAKVPGIQATAPQALRRLYVLADGEALGLEPLAGHAAVFQLVQHSYVAPALEQLGTSSFLARCARLAAAVPVRRLRRPRDLAGLDALAAFVEADAGGTAPAASR